MTEAIHFGNDQHPSVATLRLLDAFPRIGGCFASESLSGFLGIRNQVEVWFGILSRKALRGASFHDIEQLRKAIEDFVAVYGPEAKPFVWRKREVKGSQLRNTIVNLRN